MGNKRRWNIVILINVLEVHIIEIPKLINQLDNNLINKEDKLSLWIKFINNPKNIGEKVVRDFGYKEGKTVGLEESKKASQKEILNMINNDFDIQTICKKQI